MVPGTWEPRPSTGLVGSGVIPAEEWPSLVAGFNGGFAAMHGAFGMMVDRKVYLPARDGIATLAVYEDGSIRMGTWGKDLRQTPDMVSYRQNCPPLIENGTITAEDGQTDALGAVGLERGVPLPLGPGGHGRRQAWSMWPASRSRPIRWRGRCRGAARSTPCNWTWTNTTWPS